MVLEKPLESPLASKEIQLVHPKRNQSWIFIGRIEAEAEIPILWPPDAKNWLIWKDPDAGKDWGQEEKGEDRGWVVGWHHRLNGHEFEWTPRADDGQGGLSCCSPWGRRESDTTEQLNWTEQWYLIVDLSFFLMFNDYAICRSTVKCLLPIFWLNCLYFYSWVFSVPLVFFKYKVCGLVFFVCLFVCLPCHEACRIFI